jgi:hypothetical protein
MRPALGILILLCGLAGCDAAPTDTSPAASPSPGAAPVLRAAAAHPPLHEVFLDDPGVALGDIDCGTFTIRETSFSDRVNVTTYFNDAGDPVRMRVHVQFQGVLTNLSTGNTLRDHASFSDDFDFIDGTQTETGLVFHYTIPHQGLLVADNGRIVFDLESGEVLFAAGSHDVVEQGFTAICPLLT